MRMSGFLNSWGFIQDLRDCVGKTIDRVELTDLGYGYTVSSGWAVRFTDGTRAFFTERPIKGTLLFPSEEAMSQSLIFTPEECGQVHTQRVREKQERLNTQLRQERYQYEKLHKKFGVKHD